MTSRPRPYRGNKATGIAAVALFVVLAWTFVTAGFGEMTGFSGADDITARIGYAMFNLPMPDGPVGSEGFLVAFEIIDVVLVAALAAAVMLARREGEGPALTDGGSEADHREASERTSGQGPRPASDDREGER